MVGFVLMVLFSSIFVSLIIHCPDYTPPISLLLTIIPTFPRMKKSEDSMWSHTIEREYWDS